MGEQGLLDHNTALLHSIDTAFVRRTDRPGLPTIEPERGKQGWTGEDKSYLHDGMQTVLAERCLRGLRVLEAAASPAA